MNITIDDFIYSIIDWYDNLTADDITSPYHRSGCTCKICTDGDQYAHALSVDKGWSQ